MIMNFARAVVIGSLLLAGCAQPQTGETTADQTQPAATQPAQEEQETGETAQLSDEEALRKAYEINMAEVQMGQMALEKAQDPQMKQLANTIIEDHKQANERLTQIAHNLNVQLQETDLSQEHQQLAERLKGLSGDDFNSEFLKAQVDAHQKALSFYEQQAERTQSPELQTYFQDTMAALGRHMDMARGINLETEPASR